MEIRRLIWAAAVILTVAVSCKKDPDGNGGDKPEPSVITGNIQGTVVSSTGTPLEGVVVSDGLHCTKTNSKGEWGLEADLDNTDYVFVSTPSDHSAPLVDGTPVFWKSLKDLTPKDGKYLDVKFTLDKLSRADRFSILIYADPQPRSKGAGYDNMGYHALDCCADMYRDMKEYVSTLTGRPVYGIGLGDIVHRSPNLLTQHKAGFADAGVRNYNVIGNHDHDTETVFPANTPEKIAAGKFEAVLGPVNYSFNLGDLHIVVLDNMICPQETNGKFSDNCKNGLRDDIWQWLQNDLQYVSKDKTLMVCAHSPMFRLTGGSNRTAQHSADYRDLLSKYKKVLHWAGHVHLSLNYVDVNNPVIESHSVTRVTGELWTNEYLGSNGTPRGYIVFDYDGGAYKWHFKPIYYQTGAFTGTYTTHDKGKQPDYTWRDWDYVNGKAIMRTTGKPLDESYQMQVFAPGSYPGSDGEKYLYANIFLWDELWEEPKLYINSVPKKMTRVVDKNYMYTPATREIREFYNTYNSYLAGDDYEFSSSNTESVFRVFVDAEHGSGTVKVKDRFGNTYSSDITW